MRTYIGMSIVQAVLKEGYSQPADPLGLLSKASPDGYLVDNPDGYVIRRLAHNRGELE